jgi:hypothetical protein
MIPFNPDFKDLLSCVLAADVRPLFFEDHPLGSIDWQDGEIWRRSGTFLGWRFDKG